MPYIYKITNNLNGKVYIGKTNFTIEKRWKEHCQDCQKDCLNKRPLYSAMKKYGIENFFIEEVEQLETPQQAEEREKYWIEYYGSFKYGYNATKGGDGKSYADYELIYALWNEGKNIKEIQEITNYDCLTISCALSINKITAEEKKRRGRICIQKPVAKLDKNTLQILKVYASVEEAYRDLNKQTSGHIADVCRGKRQTAYGFRWKYLNNN